MFFPQVERVEVFHLTDSDHVVGNFVCWLHGLERQVHTDIVIYLQFEEEI